METIKVALVGLMTKRRQGRCESALACCVCVLLCLLCLLFLLCLLCLLFLLFCYFVATQLP